MSRIPLTALNILVMAIKLLSCSVRFIIISAILDCVNIEHIRSILTFCLGGLLALEGILRFVPVVESVY